MRRISAMLFQLTLCVAFGLDALVWAKDAAEKTPAEQLADGTVQLPARQATIHGRTAYVLTRSPLGSNVICTWTDPEDWVSWQFSLPQPGKYVVDLRYSCADGSEGSTFEVAADEHQTRPAKSPKPTGSWERFRTLKVGTIKLEKAGDLTLSIKPLSKPGVAVMNLCRVRLVPAEQYEALRKGGIAESAARPRSSRHGDPQLPPGQLRLADRFFHRAKLLRVYLSPASRSRARRPDLRLRDFRGQQHDGHSGLRAGAVRGIEAAGVRRPR